MKAATTYRRWSARLFFMSLNNIILNISDVVELYTTLYHIKPKTMSTELAKIDGPEFGALINIPATVNASKTSALNCRTHVTLLLESLKVIDITTHDLTVMETAVLPGVIEMRERVALTHKTVEAARTPYTQEMTRLAKELMQPGKDIQEDLDKLAAYQNTWELEKIRRAKVKADKDAADIKAAQDKINADLLAKNKRNADFNAVLLADIKRLNDKYNAQDIKSLPEFGEAILNWEPTYDDSDLAGEYAAAMYAEITRLVDLIPSRITELMEGDLAAQKLRIANEAAATEKLLNDALNDKTEAATMTAETDKLSTHFISSAGPVIEKAKGAVHKQKYVVGSRKAWAAILQSWVKNSMPNLTDKELDTKLKFMVTAANEMLNDKKAPEKLVAEGLSVVDDISTRTQSTKP